jgi:hypothetical protein
MATSSSLKESDDNMWSSADVPSSSESSLYTSPSCRASMQVVSETKSTGKNI